MSKATAAEGVRSALEAIKVVVGTGNTPTISEADTRAHFIDPILRAVGYTALDEIQREVYIKDTKDFIDYVLRINGQQRIAVEAKRIGHKLSDTDAGQLIQYCAVLGIEWAVLTNAIELRLYHQFAQVPLADKLLFKLDLVGWNTDAEYRALFEQVWLLSKDAFDVSDGPGAWLRAQQLDEKLRDALTNPASPEVKWLRKRLIDQKVEVSVEDVAGWFKGRLLEPAPLPGPPVPPTSASGARGGTAKHGAETPAAHETYWMVPAAGHHGLTAVDSVKQWLAQSMWGFGESTPGRRAFRPNDRLAFYAVGTGVIAYARITGAANSLVTPEEWPESVPQEKPVYKIPVADVVWLPEPVAINAALRARLGAFVGRDPDGVWAWLVQTTRRLSKPDFAVLTGQA